MKKKFLSIALMLTAGKPSAMAQVSRINPIPQQCSQQGELFDLPAQWRVVCSKALESSIARQALNLMSVKEDAKAPFTVTLALANEKAGRKAGKQLAKKAEAYTLQVSEKGISIVGSDERGLYYGVRSLIDMSGAGRLQVTNITDWPDVAWRGVVEGFYGTPWSHSARLSQLDFYGKHKMNVYIYGPKDDPYHRDHWRDPYPEAEGRLISELAEHARQQGVNFYWAIHPGVDIKWTTQDRDALVHKLELMYDLGVRAFAVFFDDIWGEGTKADKQAELLNYVDDNFISKKPDVVPLVFCPTEYNRAWANDQKGYLRTLGSTLHKSIEVMWTGNSVVHCIDKESMDWINERIQRRGYIWWNFPVSDFVRDHILLGPAYGNGLDIAPDVSGFVSNPMEHAEASKIALYGIADYTWNMQRYDADADWERALTEILPDAREALRTFALYNKDLGQNGHGFRREEGTELADVMAAVERGDKAAPDMVEARCRALRTAADVLLTNRSNPQLIRELRPWLLQAKNLADYGEAVCQMARCKDGKTFPTFDDLYRQSRSIREQMYDLENSDVRHALQPGIKVGTKVMLPMINKLFAKTVEAWNAGHGTDYASSSDYVPYKLSGNVPQLILLPVSIQGQRVSIAPSNEVIKWPAGASITIESERTVTLQGMDFNLGIAGVAKHFRLEVAEGNGEWREVSLLHYNDKDPVIHTGNELGGMKAPRLRLTNKTGEEQQVYFRNFNFVVQ